VIKYLNSFRYISEWSYL